MDLAGYRTEAEEFTTALSREYYLHFAGHKDDLAIEPIYVRHAGLFSRAAVEELRELAGADGAGEDEGRRRRLLLDFCVDGHLGLATKETEAELARREAELQIAVDGTTIGYRKAAVMLANEPDRDRRQRIEIARNEVVAEQLNPLQRDALEEVHSLTRELGWSTYRAMREDLSGIDLAALGEQTAAFTAATDERYGPIVEPELEARVGVGFGELRRADLPWFFRAADADALFPAELLVISLETTLGAMGIDITAQPNVVLDVEQRPKKSPRAFCSPVRVPQEVYLVVPRIGGRDDYTALFHEAGHTEHFAHVDAALPFEFRHLGDNSVTEGFAFLFDHLVEDPEWMRRRLGVEDGGGLADHVRAQRLIYLRRYTAKLAYELQLHGGADLDAMPAVYARLLGEAVRVQWPATTWLIDVDPGFYVASYLRAWALETHLRAQLRERFGLAWFDEPAAGDYLRALWRDGQRLRADELLSELTGAELDFSAMLRDLDVD